MFDARRTTSLIVAFVVGVVAVSGLSGCGDRQVPSDKSKYKTVFTVPPKLNRGPAQPAPKPKAPEPVKPKVETWLTKIKTTVAEVQEDLKRCRNEFMLPFQFPKMRRRDVTWVSLGEMDTVCREGTKKRRGAYKRILWLSKEQIGKHPALDRWISLGLDLSEHFRTMSLMTKKVGAPKIALITDTAKKSRDRILIAGMAMDKEARAIAALPDETKAANDPSVMGQAVKLDDFKKELAERYDFYMDDAVAAYKRYASGSWKYPEMVKYKSYRLWPELVTKLVQRDRARVAKIEGLDDKGKKAVEGYLGSVEAVVSAWRASTKRYVEGRKKDTWSEKDPFEKGLAKAQKAWKKSRDKFLGKRG